MDDVVIRLVGVAKEYRLGRTTIRALDGVSLEVERGSFLAVMGPSGSGKTTLLNIMGGLDRPTEGKVLIDGVDTTGMTEAKLSLLRRRKIGFVFQFFNLIPVLTALENIELPMVISGVDRDTRRRRAVELLRRVGLEKRANHRPDELSGGEQQRVAIARALANRPVIVLADEPTGDLDSDTGNKVVKLMREAVLAEGGTLIVATHDEEIAGHADRRVKLRNGRIHRTS